MNREVFSESEKRFLITQILKASSVPLERIFMLFSEANEEPDWDNIYLPGGRTLQECKVAFNAIQSNVSSFATPSSPGFSRASFQKRKAGIRNLESSSSATLEPKRRLSAVRGQDIGTQQLILPKLSPTESITSGSEAMFGQPILPKPMLMDSVTSVPEVSTGHQYILPKPSPVLDSGPSIPEIPIRKRGRPPKAEVERRQQALARAEINKPQAIVTQNLYGASGETSSVACSPSSSKLVSLTSSPKSGVTTKKSGPMRQPGELRFSLNNFVKSSTDRQPPIKTIKSTLAAATPAGTELSTSKTTSTVTTNLQIPASNIQLTEAQKSETSPTNLPQKSSEESSG